jgi:multidrug resistance efflux pump
MPTTGCRRPPVVQPAVVQPGCATRNGDGRAVAHDSTQTGPPRSVEPTPHLDEAPPARRRSRRLLLLLPILLLVGAAGLTVAYRYWYEATYFVTTDNAQVAGDLVQVGSLNAGRIVATRVDVGDLVRKDQEIAVMSIPQEVAVPFSGATRREDPAAGDSQVVVRAPLTGVVVARTGSAGGTVAAGQPIFALVDPSRTWIRANVEETRLGRLQPGQPVEVQIDALDRTFQGRVVAVTPASAATFSLLPAQNTSGNFVKVTQLVPVKISVDANGAILPLGTSARVRIQVRQPDGGVPWQP